MADDERPRTRFDALAEELEDPKPVEPERKAIPSGAKLASDFFDHPYVVISGQGARSVFELAIRSELKTLGFFAERRTVEVTFKIDGCWGREQLEDVVLVLPMQRTRVRLRPLHTQACMSSSSSGWYTKVEAEELDRAKEI